jgi:hypothetical protein
MGLRQALINSFSCYALLDLNNRSNVVFDENYFDDILIMGVAHFDDRAFAFD